MNEVRDERESLINEVCMYLVGRGIEPGEAKDALYIIMNKYEITSRCTSLAEMKEDRNDFLLNRFMIAKTVKGCSKRTLKLYGTELKRILQAIGKTVDDITADDIRYYLAVRQRRDGVSKTTADNELRYLRSFFQYLVADELVIRNPTAKVDRVKCERRKKDALTDIEVERLRVAVEGLREPAIIEVLLSTGCRVSELVQIQISDIDKNKVLVYGKGAKERYVYLNARAMIAIERYLAERKDKNPYLFAGGKSQLITGLKDGYKRRQLTDWWKDPDLVSEDKPIDKGTIEQLLRKIAKKAGVEKANPHKFRRTCATMALRRGMPIEQVSKMLGHEELSTTQIYLDLSEDELAQAHKKYVV